MHLGYDHTLSTVNNKSPVWRHQRHIAHEYVLLFDVFNRLGTSIFIHVEHNKTESDFERCGISHVALHTLFNVIFWLFKLVFYELKNCCLIEIFDREYRLKDTFYAFAIERYVAIAGAKKQIVRRFLNLNEIRHFKNFTDFAVVLTQAFLTKKGLSHV